MLNLPNRRRKEVSIVGVIAVHQSPNRDPLFSVEKPKEDENIDDIVENQIQSPNSPQQIQQQQQQSINNRNTSSPFRFSRASSPVRTASSPNHQRGRIHFASIEIPEEAPTDLLCEECGDKTASLYCEECKEVFCYRCADLCHPRVSANDLKHKHELNGSIRALRNGDTSSVQKEVVFYPPDEDFFFEDYEKVKDLTVPNSLRTSQHNARAKVPMPQQDHQHHLNQSKSSGHQKKSFGHQITASSSNMKFKVNDLVLFPDPVSRTLAFGKIISEFDPVHTLSAPAIIRGEGGGFQYMTQMVGLYRDKEALNQFVAKEKPSLITTSTIPDDNDTQITASDTVNATTASIPSLRDGADLMFSQEMQIARRINKRVQDMHDRQMLGPKHHYRSTEYIKTGQSNQIAAELHEYNEERLGNKTKVLIDRRRQIETYHEYKLPSPSQQVDYDRIDATAYADIDDDNESVLSTYNGQRRPIPASQRTYLDYITSLQDPKQQDARSTSSTSIESTPTIVVVAERDLELLLRRLENVEGRIQQLLISIIERRERIWLRYRVLESFMYWKRNLKQINVVKMHVMALKVQTRIRVWLCRNKLQNCRDYWRQIAEAQRMQVHGRFRYADENDQNALTFDNRVYFSTLADVNRYAAFLNLMLRRLARYLDRRRRAYLVKTIQVWKAAIYDFEEKNMQNNHIDKDLVAVDARDHPTKETPQELQNRIIEEFTQTLQSLKDTKSDVTGGEETAFTLPLRHRPTHQYFKNIDENDINTNNNNSIDDLNASIIDDTTNVSSTIMKWEDIPAYDPSDDYNWPALPFFSYKPKGFKDRLYLQIQTNASDASTMSGNVTVGGISSLGRTGYNISVNRPASYNAEGDIVVPESDTQWVSLLQGPTHHSYWMVPGMLLIGAPPYGPAGAIEQPRVDTNNNQSRGITSAMSQNLSVKNHTTTAASPTDETNDGNNLLAIADSRAKGAASATLSAVAALLMQGVDTFISLLTEEDEAAIRIHFGDTSSLEVQLTKILLAAKRNVNQVVFNYQNTIEKQQEKLGQIPNYGKTDPRFANAQRQRARCEARIELAQNNIKKMRDKIKCVPEHINFIRLPISASEIPWCPDEVLPALWQLEGLLRMKRRCYLYSGAGRTKEGGPSSDGLCGTMAAMLIGRLYKFPADEAMLRWQRAHDLMRGLYVENQFSPFKQSCPPVPWQKRLIEDVLRKSQRAIQLPLIRGQIDPETYTVLQRDSYDPRFINRIFVDEQDKKRNTASRGDQQQAFYDGSTIESNSFISYDGENSSLIGRGPGTGGAVKILGTRVKDIADKLIAQQQMQRHAVEAQRQEDILNNESTTRIKACLA